jgi:RNA recognition motif-containing protein
VKDLYVSNLSWSATDSDLRELFSQFGKVRSARVVCDRETGRSKGFGFVNMEDGADAALAALDGKSFMGRTLTVAEARPRGDRDRARVEGGT